MRIAVLLGSLGLVARALAGQAVQTVEVRPVAATVTAGESARFTVAVLDSAGRAIGGKPVNWLATPFDIAGSDSSGTVSTTRAGKTYVLAMVEGKVGFAELTVRERAPTALEIAGPDTALVGAPATLMLQGRTTVGDPVPVPTSTWRSSSPSIAEIRDGVLIPKLPGMVTITAASGTLQARHRIVVRANPVRSISLSGPAQLRVGEVGRFGASTVPLTRGLPLQWSVAGDGARITDEGRFVATKPGRYRVTATAGAVAGTGAVVVTERVDGRHLEQVGVARLPKGVQGAELWPFGNTLYLATIAGLVYVYDISSPAAPRLTDSLVTDARLINDVSVSADGKVGVLTREGASDRKNGLVFFDTSNPLHPKVVSEYTTTLTGGVHSAFIDGHYVYATSDATGSLRIIDFADPRNPREVGRYELPREGVRDYEVEFLTLSPQRYLHDVYVRDGLAYLAYWRDGVVILDVGKGIRGGSPTRPVLVSQYNYNHAALYPPGFIAGTHAVFVSGNHLFLGDESYPGTADLASPEQFATRGILQVLDISDPVHPRKVAEYDPHEFGVHNVWAQDGLLYIGGYNGGVRILDVSGELLGELGEQGRLVGSLYTGAIDGFRPNQALTWSAIPHNGYVFASDINTGLWVAKLVGGEVKP
jgi:hypothetical protein